LIEIHRGEARQLPDARISGCRQSIEQLRENLGQQIRLRGRQQPRAARDPALLVFDRHVHSVGAVELIALDAVRGDERPAQMLNKNPMPVMGHSSEKAIWKAR
jgi:hypothetical protein